MPRRIAPSKDDSRLLPPFQELPNDCISVPSTPEGFAAAREALLGQTLLGFDTESKPIFSTTQVDTGPHVVQLATPTHAWILQLHHPEALALAREVIGAAHICKVGFGLDNDKSTLPRRLGVQPANLLDLDRIFSSHGFTRNTGVRAACDMVLGCYFHKSKKVTTTNWAASQLTPAQVRYAANDAHAPAVIHSALAAWEAKQPALLPRTPRAPRPARPATPHGHTVRAPRH